MVEWGYFINYLEISMTDQEFLSQNLDVLLQDLWFPSIVKDIMFGANLIPTTIKIIFGIFFIINLIYFYKFALNAGKKDEVPNDQPTTRKGNNFVGSCLSSLFASTILTSFMYGFLYLFSFYILSTNYITLDRLKTLPLMQSGEQQQKEIFKFSIKGYIYAVGVKYNTSFKLNYTPGVGQFCLYPCEKGFDGVVEELTRGPDLDTVSDWLIVLIKDKPYKSEEFIDKQIKSIDDM
jgi:hypothetical protein